MAATATVEPSMQPANVWIMASVWLDIFLSRELHQGTVNAPGVQTDSILVTGKQKMATQAVLSFSKGDWNLRARVAAGKVWFLANDVARALGYQHPRHAVCAHVQPCWKKSYGALVGRSESLLFDRLGHNKSLEIWITELGVYALCFGSKRRDVTAFQEWVHEEVMPVCRHALGRP
jgi:hypothetical protein